MKKSSDSLATRPTVKAHSPFVRTATADEIEAVLYKISRLLGADPGDDQVSITSAEMIRRGWTAKELEYAHNLILGSAEMVKEFSYNRASLYAVLTICRDRIEVRRGRLFSVQEYRRACSPPDATDRMRKRRAESFRAGAMEDGTAVFFLADCEPFLK